MNHTTEVSYHVSGGEISKVQEAPVGTHLLTDGDEKVKVSQEAISGIISLVQPVPSSVRILD